MSATQKLERPRIPKRFYFLTLLIYFPVFYALGVIHAHWYGFVIAGLSFAALIGIRHSAAWHGWHIPLCFALAFLVAFFGLYFSRLRWDVSLPGQIVGGTVRVFVRLPMDEEIKNGEAFAKEKHWKTPKGYEHRVLALANSKLEELTREGSASEFAILQLHGGAFEAGLADLYRTMAVRYCDMAQGAAVYTLDYRLYPQYPYPAQQNDAMDAWHYITQRLGYPAEHVILTGDSAGGNLALSLTLRLRDEGKPLPAALIALSPWADLSNSGASHLSNALLDPTFGVRAKDFDGVTPVGVGSTYADLLDAKAPYVSPSFGDYAGFPKMLLQASDLEILLSDSEAIYENALKNGVDCTLTIYKGMIHVFQGALDLIEESRNAWAEMGDFVQGVVNAG
ncbi:MAG: alpha/beta hydrolase [Clostridia bacterium]